MHHGFGKRNSNNIRPLQNEQILDYWCVNKLNKLVSYHIFIFFVKMVVVKQKYLPSGFYFLLHSKTMIHNLVEIII